MAKSAKDPRKQKKAKEWRERLKARRGCKGKWVSAKDKRAKAKWIEMNADWIEPKVDQAFRERITAELQDFLESPEQEYKVEQNLTRLERAIVHLYCTRMGLRSTSTGKGVARRVSVFKTQETGQTVSKTKKMKGNYNCGSLPFSEESKEVLLDLFIHYPPGQDGLEWLKSKNRIRKTNSCKGTGDVIFCKPLMNKAEIAKKVEALSSRMKKDGHLKQINQQRSRLPIASSRDDILSEIKSNQVVLISGETGCGKTTQVPQFLLDKIWEEGEACKIICTQPRRISATSVAERISCERGEKVGETIGYKIRLESKGGRHSSVIFCTNGLLLRVLVGSQPGSSTNSNISEITHIIVDEIHERDHYSDFMLAILRDMLPRYPHLRLVLMSATIDAERFSRYFGDCPIIRVPGFTYPVKTFYLEEVLSILKNAEENHLDVTLSGHASEKLDLTDEHKIALDEAIDLAWSNDHFDSLLELISSKGSSSDLNYQHSLTGVSPLMVFAAKGRAADVGMLLSLGVDCNLKAQDGKTALDWAKCGEKTEAAEVISRHLINAPSNSKEDEQLVNKYLSSLNPELVDVALITNLLRKICADSKDGAILVFLPGWDDINRIRHSLLADPFFKKPSKFKILSLHSMVPRSEQKKAFQRPPRGCRKIILSTNIAETAVTVDDVVFVIDSGRLKEKSYDPYSNVSTLQTSWVSKASAKQREGRAGRCQPGVCYHLYSNLRAVTLPEFQIPEIKRMPIEDLCLQLKMLDRNCKIEEFLEKTLDPPVSEAIRNAVAVLKEIGALSSDGNLTKLGEKIGSLPVHPLTGRMLFFAILFKCLDPALTLACASGYKDPFTSPTLKSEKKRAAKAQLSGLYGGCSDQLAVVGAYECWKNAKQQKKKAQFCSRYSISSDTMVMLSRMRRQLEVELIVNGYIPRDVSVCSLNVDNPGILRAVLVAGLYPRIGRLHRTTNGNRVYVETASGAKIRLHSQSTLSRGKASDDLVVYDEIARTDGGLQIRSCTAVGSIPLLLLANEIVVAPVRGTGNVDDSGIGFLEGNGRENLDKSDSTEGELMSSPESSVNVVIDRWLSLKMTALEIAQIYCLRERLSAAILLKAINARKLLPPPLVASIHAIGCILSNGLSKSPLASNMAGATVTGINFLQSLFNPAASVPPQPAGSQKHAQASIPPSHAELVASLPEGSNQHLTTLAPSSKAKSMPALAADTQAPTSKRSRKKAKSVPSLPAGSNQLEPSSTPSSQANSMPALSADTQAPTSKQSRKKAKSVPSLLAGSNQLAPSSTPSSQAEFVPSLPAGSNQHVPAATPSSQVESVLSLPAGSDQHIPTSTLSSQAESLASLPTGSNQHVPSSTPSSQAESVPMPPAGSNQNVPTSTPSSQAESVPTPSVGSNQHAPISKRSRKKVKLVASLPAGSNQHVPAATLSSHAKSAPPLPAGSNQHVPDATPSSQVESVLSLPAGSNQHIPTSTPSSQAESVLSLPAGSNQHVPTSTQSSQAGSVPSLPACSNQHVPTATPSSQAESIMTPPTGSNQQATTSKQSRKEAKSAVFVPAGSNQHVPVSMQSSQAESVPKSPVGSNQLVPTSPSSRHSMQLPGANLAGYGSGVYGPYGPRGIPSKRSGFD